MARDGKLWIPGWIWRIFLKMLAVLRFVSISDWKMQKKFKSRLWKSRACVPLNGFEFTKSFSKLGMLCSFHLIFHPFLPFGLQASRIFMALVWKSASGCQLLFRRDLCKSKIFLINRKKGISLAIIEKLSVNAKSFAVRRLRTFK